MKKTIEIINKICFSILILLLFSIIIFSIYYGHSNILNHNKSFNLLIVYGFEVSFLGILLFYLISKYYEEARIFFITALSVNFPLLFYDYFYSFLKYPNDNFNIISILILIIMVLFLVFYSRKKVRREFKYSVYKYSNFYQKSQKIKKILVNSTIFLLSITILFIISMILEPLLFGKSYLQIDDKIMLFSYLILFFYALFNMIKFKKWAYWMFVSLVFLVMLDILNNIILYPKFRQLIYYIFEILGIGLIVFFNLKPVRILFDSNENKTGSG